MTEKTEQSLTSQMNARYNLMQSASQARKDGHRRETWVNHPDVRKMCSKYDLGFDILEHISAWVWTFRR